MSYKMSFVYESVKLIRGADGEEELELGGEEGDQSWFLDAETLPIIVSTWMVCCTPSPAPSAATWLTDNDGYLFRWESVG